MSKKLIDNIRKLKCYNIDCVSFKTCAGANREFRIRSRDKLLLASDVDDLIHGRKIKTAPKGLEEVFFPIKKLCKEQLKVEK